MKDVRDQYSKFYNIALIKLYHQSKKKKKNSNVHLLGYWSLIIIFIITSVYKDYEVKCIVFLAFYYMKYLLWLMTHLFVRPMY